MSPLPRPWAFAAAALLGVQPMAGLAQGSGFNSQGQGFNDQGFNGQGSNGQGSNGQGFTPIPPSNNQGFTPMPSPGPTPNNQGFTPGPAPNPTPSNQGFMPGPYPAPNPYPSPTPGPYPNPAPVISNDSGQCSLNRNGMLVFSGPCSLRRVARENRSRFDVTLANGSRYVFHERMGQLSITDGSGRMWPVAVYQQGRSGVFQFADYRLMATRVGNGVGPNGSTAGQAILGGLLGAGIGVMLNQLFQ